jgi:hypothetical protein
MRVPSASPGQALRLRFTSFRFAQDDIVLGELRPYLNVENAGPSTAHAARASLGMTSIFRETVVELADMVERAWFSSENTKARRSGGLFFSLFLL